MSSIRPTNPNILLARIEELQRENAELRARFLGEPEKYDDEGMEETKEILRKTGWLKKEETDEVKKEPSPPDLAKNSEIERGNEVDHAETEPRMAKVKKKVRHHIDKLKRTSPGGKEPHKCEVKKGLLTPEFPP
jgi:hypothetical protein